MNDRRRHGIERLPDGRLWDHDVYRAYLDDLLRRNARTTVERLSATDPSLRTVGR